MADTLFKFRETIIASSWLNDVNNFVYKYAFPVERFGAVGNGIADDTAAIQAALNQAQAVSASQGTAVGAVFGAPGRIYKTTAPLRISVPIIVDIPSYIFYYGTSGSAFIVGDQPPVNNVNTGYKLNFGGFRSIPGNTAPPTSVNPAGPHGLEIRNMQFSQVSVGNIIGFAGYGFWGNGSNDSYASQQIQDNFVYLGQIAVNGYGIFSNSVSGVTGAYQANNTFLQNSFANFVNLQIDKGNGGMADNASSSNLWTINAMDAPSPGGLCLNCNSQFSNFNIAFLAGPCVFSPTSGYNYLRVANNFETSASFNDTGVNNWLVTNSPNVGVLPITIAPPGAPMQNAFGPPVMGYCGVRIAPAAGGTTTVTLNIGDSAGTMVPSMTAAMEAGTGPGQTFPFSFMVPPLKFWNITSSGPGAVTIGNISFRQAG